jgi:hypothetical protein
VLDALLVAMRIENCAWNEDVIRAILADAPAEVPAWAYGYRGAGQSFSIGSGTAHPEVRADEDSNIVSLDPQDFALSFHHTNGRPYGRNEQLGVRLDAGDWLEFEFDPLPPRLAPRLLDKDDRPLAASFARTPRGLRVTATEPGVAARLVLFPQP